MPKQDDNQRQPSRLKLNPFHKAYADLRWQYWKFRRWFKRTIYKLFRMTKRLAGIAVSLAVIILISLTGIHWYNDQDIADAARSAIDDFRVFAYCPTQIETTRKFVLRTRLVELDLRTLKLNNPEWIAKVCAGILWNKVPDSQQQKSNSTSTSRTSEPGLSEAVHWLSNSRNLEQATHEQINSYRSKFNLTILNYNT